MVIKGYYSLSEAAEVLGKSKETLRRNNKKNNLDWFVTDDWSHEMDGN